VKQLQTSDITIATLGSHSALQILKGAKDEGFKTLCITKPENEKLYRSYDVADEIILVKDWCDFTKIDKQLSGRNVIIIPHGSFVAYLSLKSHKTMKTMYFGNKAVLEWESNRDMQREWLKKSGMTVPKQYADPEDIKTPIIVKFPGASGGKGYLFCQDKEDFYKQKDKIKNKGKLTLQEYIIGVPFYIHYFYSPLTGELEIMSMDKRYESNVDALGRIPLSSQEGLGEIEPSYTVVGNIPLVLRESLMSKALEMGEKLVETSKELIGGKGLFGPFCVETIITPEQDIQIIEISARIVAGTNLFIDGSPYSYLKYTEPMSTGRRIAREIKNAVNSGKLDQVIN